MNQLRKGAILSYITIILTNAVGLVLTPFIIKRLGEADYGLYTLIGALVAQISILNLGLNNVVIRYVAKYRTEGNIKAERNFLATVMLIYIFISGLIIITGLIFYQNIESLFKTSLTTKEIERGKSMFLILLFNLTITMPGGAFEAICNAYEHFVFPRALNIVRYVSRAILIISLLSLYPHAFTLIWIDTGLNLLSIFIMMYYAFRYLRVKFVLYRWDFKYVKEIFSYSIWIFIFAIAYQFQWFSGQTVLGMTTNTHTVAIFGVGILLGGYYGAFAGAINTLFLPKATKMTVNSNNPVAYTNEMIKMGKIIILILFLILNGFFLFGKAFIYLWVGPVYQQAWSIALLIMLVMTLPLVQGFGNSILEAKKKNRYKATISIISLSIAVIVGYFGSLQFGIYGVLVPICLAVASNSILMTFYYKRVFGLQIIYFIKQVFTYPVLLFVLLTFPSYYLLKFYEINSWTRLVVGFSFFSFVYFFIHFSFIMDKETKKILFSKNNQ